MASLTPTPKQQFIDANGDPLVGGKVYTYEAGTTTPIATYVDFNGVTQNTNPVILDSAGRADIWLITSVSYKFVIKDANDVTQFTTDNISLPLDVSSLGTPPPIGNITPNTGAFTTLSATGQVTFSDTGALGLQHGVTTERPSTPVLGMFRYNSTLNQFEGYGAAGWGTVGGGGATGGGSNTVFYENSQIVTIPYTITTGKSAMSTGPITIAASFSGSGTISGTILNITGVAVGELYVGSIISGTGVTVGTTIQSFNSGTGGVGTYVVSVSQTVASTTITTDNKVTVPSGSRWVIL